MAILDTRKILLFAGAFILILLASLWPYLRIVGTYQAIVLDLSNAILAELSPRTQIHVDEDGKWAVEVSRSSSRTSWSFTMGGERFSQLVFLNLAILPSLLLATPVRARARLGLLAYGLILLFLLHVGSVSACVYALSRLCGAGSSLFCTNLSGILSPGGELSAFALWGLLTWRVWFSQGEGPAVRGSGLAGS